MRKVRVLELRSVWGTGGGPDKTILAGAALHSDVVDPIVCYIRDARDTAFSIDARARELGLDYEEIVERGSSTTRSGRRFGSSYAAARLTSCTRTTTRPMSSRWRWHVPKP